MRSFFILFNQNWTHDHKKRRETATAIAGYYSPIKTGNNGVKELKQNY